MMKLPSASLILSGLFAVSMVGNALLMNANQSLKTDNTTLKTTVQLQEAVNQQLQQAVDFEREAAKQQKAVTDEIQRKANKAVQNVRTIIKNEPCANSQLDGVVLEQLRNQSYH